MGRIKQGILGGFSGKVAGVVGTSWKGIAVMKSLPLSVANPRTAGQVAQRGKFSAAIAAARTLLAALISVYWNPFAQRMSGYNKFISENIAAFDSDGLQTPEDFYAARGSLVGVTVSATDLNVATDTVTVSFTNNTGQGDALGTDEILVLAYNEDTDDWALNDGSNLRSSETATVVLPTISDGDVIRVWTFGSRPNKSKVSDSVYTTATA